MLQRRGGHVVNPSLSLLSFSEPDKTLEMRVVGGMKGIDLAQEKKLYRPEEYFQTIATQGQTFCKDISKERQSNFPLLKERIHFTQEYIQYNYKLSTLRTGQSLICLYNVPVF